MVLYHAPNNQIAGVIWCSHHAGAHTPGKKMHQLITMDSGGKIFVAIFANHNGAVVLFKNFSVFVRLRRTQRQRPNQLVPRTLRCVRRS